MEDGNERIVAGALKECNSRKSIEDIFRRFDVEDKAVRVDRLNDCMGNPQTFFTSGTVTTEEIYELTIQMFLTGSWKLSEKYKQLGIGA